MFIQEWEIRVNNQMEKSNPIPALYPSKVKIVQILGHIYRADCRADRRADRRA